MTERRMKPRKFAVFRLVSRFRSSPDLAARSQCPDSEVRLNLQHTPVRTSESKDTGQPMIVAPLWTRSSQSDSRQGGANFGFAALDANFGIEGHWQIYDSSAALNPKFAIGLAAIVVRTSSSRH